MPHARRAPSIGVRTAESREHPIAGSAKEAGPTPLPRAHLEEILTFYHNRMVEGEPVEEIRAQSKFFRPEVRRMLDRELDRATQARVRR